ncbi:MAG: DUF192 domain-containing protein [Cyanobacteria bacterium]|nr:DUF192 domain-containing protein [Cyanobacteriota bacterium]
MTHYFYNKSKEVLLASSARMADSFFSRLKGLLGTKELKDGEALYLIPCRSIHMFGMNYAIDALFLDKTNTVVGVVHSIEPGKVSSVFKSAEGCLELPSGVLERTNTNIGDQIEFGPGAFKA